MLTDFSSIAKLYMLWLTCRQMSWVFFLANLYQTGVNLFIYSLFFFLGKEGLPVFQTIKSLDVLCCVIIIIMINVC